MLNVVILAGGNGSRLWPLSRESLPKQFLKLTDEMYTMFQLTCLRASKLTFNNLIVICNQQHVFLVREQLEQLHITNYTVIGEPFGKNTASCIAISCFLSQKEDNILIMSSDHIFNDDMFVECVYDGLKLTEDSIVVFGIQPTSPETGYGYLNYSGDKLIKFVEKPNKETAIDYLKSGNYLWNSGNFLFKCSVMTVEMMLYSSDIYLAAKETLDNSDSEGNELKLNPLYFANVRDESIDYAVMEHCTNGKVVKYLGYWNDIGSFSSLYDHLDKDVSGNVLEGDIKCFDTQNSLIKSESGLVTTLGVKNLIIINTRDAVFISDKERSQDVKLIIKDFKSDHRREPISHAQEFKPWGYCTNIEESAGYKIKKMCIYPGKALSLHDVKKYSSHWVIISGTAKIKIGDDNHIFSKNQSVYIPGGVSHNVENIGNNLVEFIETQVENN